MKRLRYRKRGLALLMSCLLAAGSIPAVCGTPFEIVSYAAERKATVNATNVNVRSGPGTGYSSAGKLSMGASVTVIGEQTAADGVLWYQVRFTGSGGGETTGYMSGQFLKFPTAAVNDGNFESYLNSQGFPESYKPGLRELHAMYPQWTFTAFQTNLDWNTAVQNESVIGRNLVSRDSVSSWKSTAEGAYDWNTGTWPGFDGNSWVQASEDIIRYYMDPRNFLNDKYVFQFLKQNYDGSLQTREGLQSMVSGTFLAGDAAFGGAALGGNTGTQSPGGSSPGGSSGPGGSQDPGGDTGPGTGPGGTDTGGSPAVTPISPLASISSHQVPRVTDYGPGMGTSGGFSAGTPGGGTTGGTAPSSGSSSYIDIIMYAAAQSGVSPYILASMILQEQGSQGTGRSISGTVAGYEGYYNFFNIEAYQSGSMGAVERGLWWASQSGSYERPWNSVERSILGGAVYYGGNYVQKGQNTLYLKKFNVQGNNLYKHQYMTNVLAAAAEGLTLAKITSLKNAALEFSIPVYKNMPESACVKPSLDGSPNNKLSGLGVDGFALTPTFNRDTESYDLIVDPSVASVTVEAAALDSAATVSGTGTVNLQSGMNDITVSVKAGNGTVRNYVIHVIRQTNGPTYSQSIGSGVVPGGGSGPGGSPGVGPGSMGAGGTGAGPAPGNVTAPGGNPGSGSGSDSNVEIVGPPGTNNGGGGGSSGFIAPDGSNMNSYGGPSGSGVLQGPNGAVPDFGGGSGSGTAQVPAPGTTGNSQGTGNPSGMGPTVSGTSNSGAKAQVISAGTEASGLAKSIQASFGGSIVKVYTASGAEVSGLLGTGNLVQVYGSDGSPSARCEIVVKGDNNGDGKLNILDVLKAQRHILGLETLTGVYATASDVNNNGKIDITDVLAMQRDILGIQKLN